MLVFHAQDRGVTGVYVIGDEWRCNSLDVKTQWG